MRALNHTVKQWACSMVLLWCCSACAIQSGAQFAAIRPAADTWAWAVSFVGSVGDTQRVLSGMMPNTRYRIAIQARLVSGHLRLTILSQPNDLSHVLHVYPDYVNSLTAEVTSDGLGQLVIHENSYDARGGEYQVWLYTIANQ